LKTHFGMFWLSHRYKYRYVVDGFVVALEENWSQNKESKQYV
jgi:hypothetical protein